MKTATSPVPAAPAPKPVNPTPMLASKEPMPPMKPPQQNTPKLKATLPVPTARPYKEQKKVLQGQTVESENEDTTLPRQLQQTVLKLKRTSPIRGTLFLFLPPIALTYSALF